MREVAVGEHGALGGPGGAGCVDDGEQVIGTHARDRLIERIVADTLTQIDQRLKRAVAQVEDVREHVFNLGNRLERLGVRLIAAEGDRGVHLVHD